MSVRAARWAIPPGVAGAVVGALLTERVDAHLLLVLTSAGSGGRLRRLIRGRTLWILWEKGKTPGWEARRGRASSLGSSRDCSAGAGS